MAEKRGKKIYARVNNKTIMISGTLICIPNDYTCNAVKVVFDDKLEIFTLIFLMYILEGTRLF